VELHAQPLATGRRHRRRWDLLGAMDVIDSFRTKMNISVIHMNIAVHTSNGVKENA
jgi:hypothetical protein